eukprot:COSAG05_NODE_3646_length_1936_cov_1.980403_1_plen_181_part_00
METLAELKEDIDQLRSELGVSDPEPESEVLSAPRPLDHGGGGGGGAIAAIPAHGAVLRRSVSFSSASQERIAEEHCSGAASSTGETKDNDGPSIDSALLDRLVVAFFEKGNIRSPEGVVSFVGSEQLEHSGPAVAARLEQIVETLRSGRRVGLLPSNARLGPEHSVRLARLLEYLVTAMA